MFKRSYIFQTKLRPTGTDDVNCVHFAISEVLTVVHTKITVFWKVMTCSLVDKYCSCILSSEAARSTESFVLIYQTTLRHIPEHKLSSLLIFSV
jgi:hypothetical protein